MWIQDSATHLFLEVNDAFVQVTGYNKSELKGLTFTDLEIKNNINSANSSEPAALSTSFKTKSGAILHFELSVFECQFQQQDVQIFTVIVHASDEKLSTDNDRLFVQEYDSALKAFFDNSGTILVLFNKNLEITAFNPKAQIYAKNLFKTKFVIGENVVEILPPSFQNTFRKFALDALEGIETNNREVQIPHTNIWWSLRYFPLYNNTGEIFGGSFTAIDISERKKSDELLKKSEAKFKSLTENGTDMVIMYDELFKIIYRSDSAIALTGKQEKDIDTESSIFQYLHPDDFVRLQPVIQNLIATKGIKIHERFRWKHFDGHYIWLEGTLVNLLHDENVKAIVTNMRDVTFLDQAKREMEIANERFNLIAKATVDAIWDWNIQTNEFYFGDGYETLFGHNIEDLRKNNPDWKEFVHPDDWEETNKGFQLVLEKGLKNWSAEYRRLKADGTYTHVLDKAFVVFDANEKPIRIVGAVQDISALKNKNEELELFKMLVDNSSDGVVITEAEPFNLPGPIIVYANKAITKTTGYSLDELIGNTPRMFQGPQTDRNELDKLRTALEKWEPIEIEIINYKKNGEPFWVNISMAPVADEKGWYTHWISIQKDVTLRRREMEEKELLINELTSNNKELKQFSYITSHNLRAPLTNLMSILKLLDISTITDQRTVTLIEAFKSSTGSLKATLDDLIQILIIKENTNHELVVVNFEEHLQKVLSSISNIIINAEAEISFDFSAAQSIHFNSAYMESIFLNLITNAIKYSRPVIKPQIHIATSILNNQIQLTVSDNGLGMDWNKVKDKIFGLYQKFHRHPDSKGIGLYLVHSQITALGGKIEVITKTNEGTSFIITFDSEIL